MDVSFTYDDAVQAFAINRKLSRHRKLSRQSKSEIDKVAFILGDAWFCSGFSLQDMLDNGVPCEFVVWLFIRSPKIPRDLKTKIANLQSNGVIGDLWFVLGSERVKAWYEHCRAGAHGHFYLMTVYERQAKRLVKFLDEYREVEAA